MCSCGIIPSHVSKGNPSEMTLKTVHHEKMIFVFGSNLAGRHGKGAAKSASRFFGAKQGVGEGSMGQCYAIPTKDSNLNTLSLDAIFASVKRFVEEAERQPEKQFMVTRLGCGLASYSDLQMAKLFTSLSIPKNVILPGAWLACTTEKFVPRIIIAGSRGFKDYDLLKIKCSHILSRYENVEIVSGTADGADQLGERFQQEMNFELVRFPAAWDRFGKTAGWLRNAAMSWYATHLIAFWDHKSPGTKNMIAIAKEDGLKTRVISV